FEGSFTVPSDAQPGTHTVSSRCTDSTKTQDTENFEVTPPPTLLLSPSSGPAGSEVTASGSGYGLCSASDSSDISIALLWDGDPLARVAGTGGSFSGSFTVPRDAEPGTHTVAAACENNPRATAAAFEDNPRTTKVILEQTLEIFATEQFEVTRVQQQQPVTLLLSPSSGPPGSVIAVSGSGHGRCSDAQSGDTTVALFWDDVPLGTVSGKSGSFSVLLRVPSDAERGAHRVSTACKDSFEILAIANFDATPQRGGEPPPPDQGGEPPSPAVIEVGTKRSFLLPSMVLAPTEVSTALVPILQSLALTVLLIVLVGFPAEVFNKTLEENYDEIRGWFDRLRAWGVPRLQLAPWAQFVGFAVVASLLTTWVDIKAKLDSNTAAFLLGIMVVLPLTALIYARPGEGYSRVVSRTRSTLHVLPLALVVAALCALFSRAANFEPGYVYGLFVGYAVVQGRMLSRTQTGRVILISALCLFAFGLLVWVGSDHIQLSTKYANPGFGERVFYAMVSETFMLSIGGIIFTLAPLRFLDGYKLAQWSRGIWVAVYAPVAFFFVHVLLLKQRQGGEPATAPDLVEALTLFIAFGMLSFAFWAYFRYRPTERSAKHYS
ncbi:MAG: FGLLP motif-containing membrane protein, partial [Egibacteraceae bacterium]